MKTLILRCSVILVIFSLQLTAAPLTAEKIEFRNKKVLALPTGKVLVAPNEIALPFDIVVRTNGTFTVQGGKARQLQEGEILGSDGMLIKPDGSIVPVIDHVTMNRGKVVMYKDGVATEVTGLVQLSDGSSIVPEGVITPYGGAPRRLLDGEIFKLNGGSVPARDTITMKNGKVIVQKDGSQFTVEPNRSVTMNDGTKVLSDGKIIKFNGDQITLSEGQIYTLEGVVKRPR
jgi:hypothetical protein